MLENWRFDIFWPPHWMHAWNLWLSGWVIDTPKEWAFILIIFAFIPSWLTGWIALSLIPFEVLLCKAAMYPVNLIKALFTPIKAATAKAPVVVKKKSYKEIRPAGRRTPIYDYNETATPQSNKENGLSSPSYSSAPTPAVFQNNALKDDVVRARETFSHSLFNLDDEDDDFDLDFDSFEKSDIFENDKKQNEDKAEAKSPSNRKSRFDLDEDDDDMSFTGTEERFEKSKGGNGNRGLQANERESDTNKRSQKSDARRDNRKESRDENRKERGKDKRRDSYDSDSNRRDRSANDKNTVKQTEKSKNNNSILPSRANNPVADILQQRGYDIISGTTVKSTIIDFIGVAEGKICVCLIDKEPGDWLADEERFNNEEPLWFSESSHRISPVRKVDLARQAIVNKLEDNNFEFEVKSYVIIQMGNIINAEDMFEIWHDLNVQVTRINRGSPKEIRLFSKVVEEASAPLEKSKFENLRKLIRGLS